MLRSLFKMPHAAPAAAFAVLAVYLGLGLFSMIQQSMTYDEPRHLQYGLSVLKGNTTRFDDSKMPATALNALPVHIKNVFWPREHWSSAQILRVARIATLLAGALLGWLIFLWACELGGYRAGLLSLLFFVLDPNLAAHFQWVTTDTYGALGITLAAYLFWRFLKLPDATRGILAGIGLGLSLLAKFTSIYLFVLFPLLAIFHYITLPGTKSRSQWADSIIIYGIVMIHVSLAVLAAGYLGNGWGVPLADYNFKSDLFKALQNILGILSHIPLPFPKPFIEGLDWVKFYEGSSLGRGPAYLFGQLSRSPFSNYYAWTVWYKLPIGILLLMGWAIFAGAVRSVRSICERSLSPDLVTPFAVAVFFMIYFNFFCGAQLGIRLLLVLFPALYVYAGVVLSHELRSKSPSVGLWIGLRYLKFIFFALLLGWAGISVGGHYPHLLGYFNEMAGKPTHYYRVLADSNLEWGQNDLFVKQYAANHPSLKVNPQRPVVGRIAISSNFLLGIVLPTKYVWTRWLIDYKEPVDHIAFGYLVYDLDQQDIDQINGAFPLD